MLPINHSKKEHKGMGQGPLAAQDSRGPNNRRRAHQAWMGRAGGDEPAASMEHCIRTPAVH
eukprot:454400-Pyramimonas_sp.AAC.1